MEGRTVPGRMIGAGWAGEVNPNAGAVSTLPNADEDEGAGLDRREGVPAGLGFVDSGGGGLVSQTVGEFNQQQIDYCDATEAVVLLFLRWARMVVSG